MRFKSKIVIAAGCIFLLGLSAPAVGAPKQKGAVHSVKPGKSVAKNQKGKIAKQVMNARAKARHAREERAARLVSTPISETPKRPLLGWPTLVSEARKYMGTNPTARSRLWCATFMNMVLAKVGYSGTNSDAAKSFAQYGRRISEPRIGAIAVLTRGTPAAMSASCPASTTTATPSSFPAITASVSAKPSIRAIASSPT